MPPVVKPEIKVRGLLVVLGQLLRVADGSAARWFGLCAGKVTSQAGAHPRPAAALVFGSAAAALTMLSLHSYE